MRCLILADIHSNLAAFKAVLADAGQFDRLWCLGDVIGYGPQPNECIEKLRGQPYLCVAGNHDWAAVGKLDVSAFNPYALQACLWTRDQLTEDARQFIEGLPERLVEDGFTVVHGSPRYPIWEYITDCGVAGANLSYFATEYCLFGHTHVPSAYHSSGLRNKCEDLILRLNDPMEFGKGRLLINPGGVGQPRDGDPRASYAILDLEANTIEYRRVPYAVEETQQLMVSLGLPDRLANRLAIGW